MSTEGTSRLRITADTKEFSAAINTAQNQLSGFSSAAIEEYNKLNRAEKTRADSLIRQARALGMSKDQQMIYNASLRGVPTNVLRDVQKNILNVNAANERAAASAKKLRDFLNGVVKVGSAAAFGSMTGSIYAFIKATTTAQKEQAQLKAVLESTGFSVGFSQEQLNKMAFSFSSLNGKSLFSPGEITEAQTRLLSYSNIVGEAFPKAMQATIDMATRMGMDVKSSAETIGRALDIPSEGLTALTRQGFRFSEEQKKLVERLEETGRVSEAQQIVLEALESSYGGAAEAASNTFEGALKRLQHTLENVVTGDEGSLNSMTVSIDDLTKTMSDPEIRQTFQDMVRGLFEIASAAANALSQVRSFTQYIAESLTSVFYGSDKPVEIAQEKVVSLRREIENLRNYEWDSSAVDYQDTSQIDNIIRQKEAQLATAEKTLSDMQGEAVRANFNKQINQFQQQLLSDVRQNVKIDSKTDVPIARVAVRGGKKSGSSKEEREALKIQQNYIKELTRMNAQFDALIAQSENKRNQTLQQFSDELSMFGLGSKAQDQIKGQRAIIDSFQDMFDDLEKATAEAREAAKLAGAEFDEAPYIEARRFLNEQLDLRLQDLKDYYAQVDVLEGSYGRGLKQGLADFADEANNVFQNIADTVKTALDGTASALTEFTMSGKADFKDLANSVIADLIKIQYQKALTGIFGDGSGGGIFGGIFGGLFANAKGGVYSSPSLRNYSNQVVDSPKLFAFARGGVPNLGLMGEAGSEAIMPLRRGSDGSLGVQAVGGSGGGDVSVTVIVNGDGSSQTNARGNAGNALAKELEVGVVALVKQTMAKERKPGGMWWNAEHGRAG